MIDCYAPLLSKACQMVLVEAESRDSVIAELTLFERNDPRDEWQQTGISFPVVIGKNGLAYDATQSNLPPGNIPIKTEGDGKAPEGVFSIISAFGYQDSADWIQMPYTQCTGSLKCVDDSNSAYYNRIVDENAVAKDWNSAENMLRDDGLYKWGLVIGYNTQNPLPGCGSCLFIHIWRSENEGTEGCTAMSDENMQVLLQWLNIQKNPILVQGIEGSLFY